MTPEFRAIEASGCVDIAAPCCWCGKESHCFAEDGLTGKDVCQSCCNGCDIDDETHIDEVDNGDYCPMEDYCPSDDPIYSGYYDDVQEYDDGGF